MYLDLGTSSRARSSCCKSCGGNETPTIFCLIDIINKVVILENYLVYLSRVPGHRKLLPKPCPQCGAENGGVQFVFFNPRFYQRRTGYPRHRPYHLLRIIHYSKQEYHSKKNKNKKYKPTKIWHTFQFSGDFTINYGSEPDIEVMSIDRLFDQPDYVYKHSVTFTLSDAWLNYYKKNGWPRLKNEGAHWFNKPGPKRCQNCGTIVEELRRYLRDYDQFTEHFLDGWWIWLCESCYSKEKNRKAERQKEIESKPLVWQ
jgi:hypothetical protein